ncbi:MAG: hypothetical protein NXI20_27290 [bacterium]|nr:hypothetical protein [bacterium]
MKKLLLIIVLVVSGLNVYSQQFEHFVTRNGAALMDGEDTLRFISWNIPNLNYVEDELTFENTNPYGLPNEYEMRDAFETVKEMGGQVIRIYTIPVFNKNFPKDAPTFVEGPGQFNEEAFKVNDMMLALANEYKIRIIFSFLNNWQWMGGRPNYAEFRGKTSDEFWTDKQLIEDFKKTIEFTINRTNTITGVKYKDDKSILCWETGNELGSPYSWTKKIAAYIKKLDSNHLLMDGYYAIDGRPVLAESVADKNIDIISSHHYERNPLNMMSNIDMNLDIVKDQKPYMIGEFGFESSSGLECVMNKIIADESICGALSWSIRYHHRNGGFYWHSEPLGLGVYKAYHWPGFASGEKYDERSFLWMYREKAFEIQGKKTPPVSIPKVPKLFPIEDLHEIKWQGVAGAEGYNIQRKESNSDEWSVVGYNISDAEDQVWSGFHDKTAKIGKSYFYRISAQNSSGASEYSESVGPVEVKRQVVVDNMKNYGVMFDMHNVRPTTGEDRTFKEIDSRIEGDYGAEIVYHIPGSFASFSIYSFEFNDHWHFLEFHGSVDGKTWGKLNVDLSVYHNDEKNYNYASPKKYSLNNHSEDINYLKIRFLNKLQLARVELFYK